MARAASSVAIRPRAIKAIRSLPFGAPTGSRRSGGLRDLWRGGAPAGDLTDLVAVVDDRVACVRAVAGVPLADGRRADVDAGWRSVTGSSPEGSNHQVAPGPVSVRPPAPLPPSAPATCT